MRVAVWRPIVTERIAERRLKASSVLTDEDVRVRWIDETEVRAIDPQRRALRNVSARKICEDPGRPVTTCDDP
jgi:hypothetical protein